MCKKAVLDEISPRWCLKAAGVGGDSGVGSVQGAFQPDVPFPAVYLILNLVSGPLSQSLKHLGKTL